METKGYIRNSQEREINLASMFFYILKGWKAGVIALAVGLVIGIALGAYQDSRPYEPEDEEELLQIANMKNRYESYLQTVEERNKGYLTTLSSDKDYYYGSVEYYISATNETDTTLLGNLLNITSTSDYLYDLREILGISEDVYISSLDSLMNSSFEMYSSNSNIKVSLAENADKEVGYGLLTYSFSYLEKEQIELLIQYVDSQMAERAAEQAGAYTYTLEKFRTSVLPYTSDVVLSAQSSIDAANLNDLTSFHTYLDELAKTESETIDYENMVKQFCISYLDEEKPSSIKKFGVLGAVGVFVLWGLVAVCRFLFSGCLYTVDELSQGYGLQVLGVLAGTKKKGVDAWLAKFAGEERKAYCSLEYLADSIALFGKAGMALVSVGKSAYMLALASKLEGTSKGGVVTGDLLVDAELLKRARENGGLILMVSLGKTKASELAAVLEVCSAHDLCVHGVIAVNEN